MTEAEEKSNSSTSLCRHGWRRSCGYAWGGNDITLKGQQANPNADPTRDLRFRAEIICA
jgi:hypothetical protein